MTTRDALKTVMTADDRLDDLKRARIWSRLEEKLEAEGKDAPARGPLMSPKVAGGAVMALAAAAIATVVLWPAGDKKEVALTAPADGMLTANLGPHAHATLVGSTQVTFEGTPGEATAVRLKRGQLFAEFEGGPGRSLRIEAPGAVITIVGTRFSVETVGDGTCVSVSHGKVKVEAGGAEHFVSTGETWCTSDGEAAPAKIAPKVQENIERFTSLRVAVAEDADAQREVAVAQIVPPPAPVEVPHVDAPALARVEPPAPALARVEPPAPARIVAPAPAPAPARVETPVPARVDATVAPVQTDDRRAHLETPAKTEVPAKADVPAVAASTAEQRYEAAEHALATGDSLAADRILAELIDREPASKLVDEALFERARLAFARQAWRDSRNHLDALVARKNTSFAEPAHYLRCRIDVESHDRDAATCLAGYRTAFPKGPHDADVAGLLVQLAHAAGGCDAAKAPIADLVRDYPNAKLTRAWTARCQAAK